MQPRKETSIPARSSRLPRDFMAILKETLLERWPEELKPFELITEGRVFPEEIFLRIGLREPGQLRQVNFEASLDFDIRKDKAEELLHFASEALESALQTYLETIDDSEFPLAWREYEWQNRPFYFQLSRVHSDLENQADALLAAHGLDPNGESEEQMPEEIVKAIREKLEGQKH